ncbi:hypothetical protein KCA24_07840, partial [Escherichia coli]|nr:hypothetical protein [Escherichia coli]
MDSHTLIQALIYLGSAALIVPIAVRLGLGPYLGTLPAASLLARGGRHLLPLPNFFARCPNLCGGGSCFYGPPNLTTICVEGARRGLLRG